MSSKMTCSIKDPKTDFYVPEKNEITTYDADQTVVIREKFLKYLSSLYSKTRLASDQELPSVYEWYPFVNSYYPYTEDVDAFARVNHLLGNKPSFASLSSFESESDTQVKEPYSERSAQLQYLESNPVSFIILGKPCIGQQDLGRQLAEYWHCVYIDPEVLIEQEIESGTRAGQCIEFNLRCGRAIGIDVILRLVAKRVKSESAKHRGFVICGLPLIPNDLYEEDPISSESAVFNVKEIFEELLDTTVEIGIPPSKPHVSISSKYKSEEDEEDEEEVKDEADENVGEEQVGEGAPISPQIPVKPEMPVDVGPDFDLCGSPEIGTNYEDQLNFLFDLMKSPFFIIYVMCSTADVINKRANYRFDVYSKQTINLQTVLYNNLLFSYFSMQQGTREEIPEEFFETNYIDIDTSDLQHLVRLPRHFPANVTTQLDSYHYTGLNFIERRVLTHNPQFFIKVDGRVNTQRMFSVVKARLKVLPLQQVIVPAKLNVIEEGLDLGEGGPHEFNVEGLTFEECYREFCKRQVPSSIFKWNWSDWGTRCPVSLRQGALKDGDPNYAVHFMNKMFFLADEEAFLKFYRNPRPYLLPPYPKPTCRIFVFGPRCSGKTAVAHCLGYVLDGTILRVGDMLQKFLLQREEEFKEKLRQAAIAEAMQLLNEQRIQEAKELEAQRVEDIKEWVINIKTLINNLIFLLEQASKETTTFEISSFPMAMRVQSTLDIETAIQISILKIREELEVYNFPFHERIQDWENLLKDKRKLLTNLPQHFRTRIEPKPATIFDDFVIEYAEKAVANATMDKPDVNTKNLVDIFRSNMIAVEESQLQQGNSRGGWILDGIIIDLEMLDELNPDYMPDEVIVLHDEDSADFLTERFRVKDGNSFREYRQFFLDIGKLDAAWRSPSVISTESLKIEVAQRILSEMLDNPLFYDEQDTGDSKERHIEAYREEVSKFNSLWEPARRYFLDLKIEPIEVKVTNKSLPELMKEVIKRLEDKYKVKASLFTEEDRAEEVKNLGTIMLQRDAGEGDTGEDLLEQMRRYGDTYCFCPVTYFEKWVLWRGKEDYAVKFEDKLYFFCNEVDMNRFLVDPRSFLTGNPPEEYPPPRICVVGIPGVGKTSVCNTIAKNFGLMYVSYEELLKKYLYIYSSECFDELRRKSDTETTLSDYLNANEPLPEEVFKDLISKIWFEHPTLGFVFDDFPKRPADIEYMTKYKLIPDVVIHLTNTSSEISKTLLDNFLNRWELEMNEKQMMLNEGIKNKHMEWEVKRKKRFEELMDERRERRYALKMQQRAESPGDSPRERARQRREVDERTEISAIRTDSQVSFDSVAEQEDIGEVTRVLDVELPEPVPDEPLETIEEATERFGAVVSDTVDLESVYLANIKTLCEAEMIPLQDVITDFDFSDITIRKAYVIVDKIKYRTKSFFERCYDVSVEVADRLLSCGYYFLSKFGKTCPVQYYENKNPVQMYLPMEQKYNIFPVIHRSFIYFVVGKESQIKFKEDPMKYISLDNFNFPLIPFKVAIIGPPKCGKSILSERIKNEFGLNLFSRGQAARYVLSYLPFSELARNMENVLRKGWELTDEMVAKCVEAASLDARGVTQGVIFDGFPNTISEVKHLSYIGLVPNLVIDLQATNPEVFECLSNDTGRRGFPRYSERFIDHILTEWLKTAQEFRDWFDREYQVLTKIPINTSNWSVWSQTREYITSVFFEIKHYHVHISRDWPLRLANMQVTPLEILERQGCYKTYCPCCLHYENALTNGGDPPDRTGLVQFRFYFYWLCSTHIEKFLKTPEAYLVPYNNHSLPQHLPVILHLKEIPDNLFEDGVCVVCYGLKRIVVKGDIAFAVGYMYKVFLFDTQACLAQFMKTPQKFMCDINFKPPENYPLLKYEELPVLGMLEQYVAKYITKALGFISRRRPVIPGLSIQASAAVGLGLYLKIFNQNIPDDYKPFYREADALYHDRRTKLLNFLDNMKSFINPYLYYEEPMPEFEMPFTPKSESSESLHTTMTKLIDDIVDNIDYDE